MKHADCELLIRAGDNQYVADLTLYCDDPPIDMDLAIAAPLTISEETLREHTLDVRQYSEQLTAMVFASDELCQGWAKLEGHLDNNLQVRLRMRLDPSAKQLHGLRWELLRAPDGGPALCRRQQIVFSRYISGEGAIIAGTRPARAVALVASPRNLELYGLPSFDPDAQLELLQTGLESVAVTALTRTLEGGATLTRLRAALNQGYPLLYLMCHGTVLERETKLWLEDADGLATPVAGHTLVEHIESLSPERKPRIIVLVSCLTAGIGQGEDIGASLGSELVRAGVPAVIGFQGLLPVSMARQLIPAFLKHLWSCGAPDLALARARSELGDDEPWWMPVLYLRLRDGQLWPSAEAERQPSATEGYREEEATYRALVVAKYERMLLPNSRNSGPSLKDIPLSQIFVPLSSLQEQGARSEAGLDLEDQLNALRNAVEPAVSQSVKQREASWKPISLGEVLRDHAMILGGPGSGKSTLLRWLAVTYAAGTQDRDDRVGPLADTDRLPILVNLGLLAQQPAVDTTANQPAWTRWLKSNGGAPQWIRLLPEFIAATIDGASPHVIERALSEQRCLLLFDSLDEIADSYWRRQIARSLEEFITLHVGNRLVIGSRLTGANETRHILQTRLREYRIENLSSDALRDFIWFWFKHLAPEEMLEEQVSKADAVYGEIEGNSTLKRLATNPLLSSLLLQLKPGEKLFPERRVELYERFCHLLLERWAMSQYPQDPGTEAMARAISSIEPNKQLRPFAAIAYHTHVKEKSTTISRDEIKAAVTVGPTEEQFSPDRVDAYLDVEIYINVLVSMGILQQLEGENFSFLHLTLQEYLAARHLAMLSKERLCAEIGKMQYRAYWREVILLCIGHLGASEHDLDRQLADELVAHILAPHATVLEESPLIRLIKRIFLRRQPKWSADNAVKIQHILNQNPSSNQDAWLSKAQIQYLVAHLMPREYELAARAYFEYRRDSTDVGTAGQALSTFSFKLLLAMLDLPVCFAANKAIIEQACQLLLHDARAKLEREVIQRIMQKAQEIGLGRLQYNDHTEVLVTLFGRIAKPSNEALRVFLDLATCNAFACIPEYVHDDFWPDPAWNRLWRKRETWLPLAHWQNESKLVLTLVHELLTNGDTTSEDIAVAISLLTGLGLPDQSIRQVLFDRFPKANVPEKVSIINYLALGLEADENVVNLLLRVCDENLGDQAWGVEHLFQEAIRVLADFSKYTLNAFLVLLQANKHPLARLRDNLKPILEKIVLADESLEAKLRPKHPYEDLPHYLDDIARLRLAAAEKADLALQLRKLDAAYSLLGVNCLRDLGPQLSLDTRIVLHESLSHPSPQVRASIIRTLAAQPRLEEEDWASIRQAATDEASLVRRTALEALRNELPLSAASIRIAIECLYDPDLGIRNAANALFQQAVIISLEARAALRPLLSHTDPAIRTIGATAMGSVGQPDETHLVALLEACKDTDAVVRQASAASLGRLRTPRPKVIRELVRLAKDSRWEHNPVRAEAILSMGRLGTADDSVRKEIMTALGAPEPRVRYAATLALGYLNLDDASVMPALEPLLSDTAYLVCEAALISIAQLARKNKEALERLAQIAETDGAWLQIQAVTVLGRIDNREHRKRVRNALEKGLDSTNWQVREAAAFALQQTELDDDALIERLIDMQIRKLSTGRFSLSQGEKREQVLSIATYLRTLLRERPIPTFETS